MKICNEKKNKKKKEKRFTRIFRYHHVSDSQKRKEEDRNQKIKEMLSILLSTFQSFYNLGRMLSVDEMMGLVKHDLNLSNISPTKAMIEGSN